MLPPQLFYAPVYKVRCSQVVAAAGVTAADSCRSICTLTTKEDLLVFIDFPEPECKHDEMMVTLKINDVMFCGVPLKMLDITGHVSATVNDIRIKSCSVPDGLCDGYLTVHVVNKTPEHELVRWCGDDYLKGMDNLASTHQLVKKAVGDENTQDIIVDFITLALTCPLSRTRIKVPCRGPRCSHVQAFDAMAYLEMNESTLRPLWRCPVCDQSIKVEELRIDLFALDLLGRIDSSCGAVNLFPGGRLTPVVKPVDVILIGDSHIKPPDVDRNLDLSVIDLISNASSKEDD